ncbi:MAG: hypothetical protein WC473_02960 [Patescibacteria group bacterium]
MAIQILCGDCNKLFVMTPANAFQTFVADAKHMETVKLEIICPHCQRNNSAELYVPKPNDREHDGITRRHVGELSFAGRFTSAAVPELGKSQQEYPLSSPLPVTAGKKGKASSATGASPDDSESQEEKAS